MILLFQYRTDQSGPHEVACFYDGFGVPYNEMAVENLSVLWEGESLEDAKSYISNEHTEHLINLINKAEAVVFGGWGEASFNSKDPHSRAMADRIRAVTKPLFEHIFATDKPLLGVCFGFQLVADAKGMKVIRDETMSEAGIVDVMLTEDGKTDPIFAGLTSPFSGNSAHKDTVVDGDGGISGKLPEGVTHLASSEKAFYHGLKVGPKQYALLFHPELDEEKMMFRLTLYPDYKKADSVTEGMPQIQTLKILKNFVDIVRGK